MPQEINAMFARLISHQPAELFSQNKPAPAISHQPSEQNLKLSENTEFDK
jgi:hypothetical protein